MTMPQTWGVLTETAKDWFVGAETLGTEPKDWPADRVHGEIIIPICQLEGLSPEQIGVAVLSAIPCAQACYADHVADFYRGQGNQSYYRSAPHSHKDMMVYDHLPLLEKYQDSVFIEPHSLDESIEFLRVVKAQHEARVGKKPGKSIHPARKLVSQNYDAIFMRIGRRDGFRCGACLATSGLHLDHVLPVSCGGGSEDDNLQILCGPCNSSKGTKTIDYRQTTEVSA